MNISLNTQVFPLFKRVGLYGLLTLSDELESLHATDQLKARVKMLHDKWAELSAIIEKELDESGLITRYTYLEIQDITVEIKGLGENLLNCGLHQWADKACLALEGLKELLRQSYDLLFLPIAHSLKEKGLKRFPFDDYEIVYHNGREAIGWFEEDLVQL